MFIELNQGVASLVTVRTPEQKLERYYQIKLIISKKYRKRPQISAINMKKYIQMLNFNREIEIGEDCLSSRGI